MTTPSAAAARVRFAPQMAPPTAYRKARGSVSVQENTDSTDTVDEADYWDSSPVHKSTWFHSRLEKAADADASHRFFGSAMVLDKQWAFLYFLPFN